MEVTFLIFLILNPENPTTWIYFCSIPIGLTEDLWLNSALVPLYVIATAENLGHWNFANNYTW